MTPEETKQAAAVMIAHADGKKIQFKYRDAESQSAWSDIADPIWNFECSDYRIAPEPLEVEAWVHPDGPMHLYKIQQDHQEWIAEGWTLRRVTIHPEEVKPWT